MPETSKPLLVDKLAHELRDKATDLRSTAQLIDTAADTIIILAQYLADIEKILSRGFEI